MGCYPPQMAIDQCVWLAAPFKFGADFIRQFDFSNKANWARGQYSFNGQYSGNGFSDFLLGLPSSATRTDYQPGQAALIDDFPWGRFAIFAQDDRHISPRLTINLGLRYEKNLPVVEENNVISNWIVGEVNGTPSLVEIHAPDPTYGRRLCIPTNLDFAPRIGIAYQLGNSQKTVVRAGYGIVYSDSILQPADDLTANPAGTSAFDLANTSIPSAITAGGEGYSVALNPHDGRTQQWTLGIQRYQTSS